MFSTHYWGCLHREQFIWKFGCKFCHQTLLIKQCTLQIYIKQAMNSSELYKKNCSSPILAVHYLLGFLLFWYDLNKGKPRQPQSIWEKWLFTVSFATQAD